MCTVSWSEMPCCAACSSSRSKKYLTARGAGRLALRITWNRSSTNFCRVPCGDRAGNQRGGQRGAPAPFSHVVLGLCEPPAAPKRHEGLLPPKPRPVAINVRTFMDSRRVR